MNVTLGIPRLQEILTSASQNIKTPFMTCPLRPNKSTEEAICIADKLKKITVADIIKDLDVTFIPAADCNDSTITIYILKMKLWKPNHYPKYTDVTLEDWEKTLRVVFVRELEDAIQKHLILLSKIRGVTSFAAHPKSHSSNDDLEDADDNGSEYEKKGQTNDDDDDGGGAEGTEGCEDLGLDAQKRKLQSTDEVDYEDDLEEETNDGELSDEFEKGDENDSDIEVNDDDKNVTLDANNSQGLEKEKHSKPKSIGGKDSLKTDEEIKFKTPRRDYDRSFFVNFEGTHFEIHFKFTREPHILLGQIAETAAKKVCIKNFGKVGECKAITCKESGVIYYGEDGNKKEEDIPSSVKEKIPALQTTGVHIETFWGMQDDLDIRYIYSNNVHAMLNAFGVEAARETIIRETQNVFKSYGISINIRHLTLIADFMTHTGGYRPMNRLGGVAESTSPFLKMCSETASKFIVEAAYLGQVDNLETPSSRICLGLPVKMGTGCHDLIQSYHGC